MSKQKLFRAFQIVFAVTITLFLAGVVVPNLMGTSSSADHRSFLGSPYAIQIVGLTLNFKLQNILSAGLGVLFGIVAALFATSPTLLTKSYLLSVLDSRSRDMIRLQGRGIERLETDLNVQTTR